MMDWNPANWNWNQAKAGGKHVATFAAGGVAAAVALHFISGQQGTEITGNINDVVEGLTQAAKGAAGLVATGLALYNGLKAATNASPQQQVKSVVQTLSSPQNGKTIAEVVSDANDRKQLINAVAKMPEVRAIVATPAVARDTFSPKVVASPEAVQQLPPVGAAVK
jgi:hypothetical protein